MDRAGLDGLRSGSGRQISLGDVMMAIGGEAVRTVGDRVKVTVEWDEA